jgi:pyruvate dehydrogenase E2 component (dihydrolipoamide acetyltransferase)
VSPRARRIARELGLDPASLTGSGPQGMVTEADVRAAAVGRAGEGAVRPDAGERARRAIAHLTVASWRSIPHFYLQLEADVEAGLDLAKPTPLICAATAQALVRHPECNLGWEGDRPVRRSSVDLGLLVDTSHGLLITVVNDAQDLAMSDMAEAIGRAVERARSGRLAASDMGPRSLTVSNLGMHAVDRFAAVIPTPDVLTLAVGRTRIVPHWDGTMFTPRRVIALTLSVDHRALDGATAARFLTALEAILANPVAEGLA